MIYERPGQFDDSAVSYSPAPRSRSSALPFLLVFMLTASAALAIFLPKMALPETWAFLPTETASSTTEIPKAEQQKLIAATMRQEGDKTVEGDAAEKINEALPFSSLPVEDAVPFKLANANNALRCLTQAIYFEAGFESITGRRAVAQVILNRMRHPAFTSSVCGVVYQGSSRPSCQFSFTCDGSLLRTPEPRAWSSAREIAVQALSGFVEPSVGTATHYHANYVSPYWAPKLTKITKIGAHIFYRWPGNWGRKNIFITKYSGNEFIPAFSSLANINVNRNSDMTIAVDDDAVPNEELGAPASRDITDRRAEYDTGGRLDTTKPWRLTIPFPNETNSAFQELSAKQQSAVAETSPSTPSGGAEL